MLTVGLYGEAIILRFKEPDLAQPMPEIPVRVRCRHCGGAILGTGIYRAAAVGDRRCRGLGLTTGLSRRLGARQSWSRAALPGLPRRVPRADRESAGIRAVKTPTFEIDVGVAASFGSSSDDVAVRRGMPDLGTLVEFGPRLKWHLGQGPGKGRLRAEFPLRGVFELNDRLAHKGMAFEPELIFERRAQGGWSYSTSIGAVWGDRRLADMFYGVAAVHATAGRTAYVADSGLIAWRLSASLSRDLSPDLRLFGFAHVDNVAGAANESSPLVQQKTGASVGLGLTYTWKRSESRATD